MLINAAGILGKGTLERHSAGDIDRVLRIDLGATVHACRLGIDADDVTDAIAARLLERRQDVPQELGLQAPGYA